MTELPLKSETWVVTDGRIGMLNQCKGLAEAVGLPWVSKEVHPSFPWTILPVSSWPAPFLSLTAKSSRFDPPWPRLVIGCGWRSIPFVIEVKRRTLGKAVTVQLQDPKVPPELFDLVIPPEHDQLSGPNVVPMIGSPNNINAAKLNDATRKWRGLFQQFPSPRVAVLIGGKSKSHRFDEADAQVLADQLRELSHQGYSLLVTTSRRTGDAQLKILKDSLTAKTTFLWDGQSDNPYLGMLAFADAILVTSDSTNMMVEAGSTGKPVHIIQLENSSPKFRRLTDQLEQLGIARKFAGKIGQWTYDPLNETTRVAEIIRGKLGFS
ncbi:MAG: mitochondrial fission ELM1 family protein [Micropepsaceae bacterium]